ncbi:DMT family transporter [Wohlfahrtiimonas chitiniclastica]|uniref:DMT family transporter n=1 Tax=Wohlfahrtiimonas chitiniclastica TaxID=400946 RepID=UPI001BD0AD41|nr:DMT family transporter [Wohlfahrtiimonas chitiniclastica]MBS7815433.1 DMT family transporter [Wohlfahrtiimonas chitiniclastica]
MSTPIKSAKLGFFLSLFTAFIWGNVPIAIKEIMQSLDAPTLVWYRFVISLAILWPILAIKKSLPIQTIAKNPKSLLLLSVLTLGIIGNFVLFSASLSYTTPTVSQIVMQLSSVGLLFAGVIFFKERLSIVQMIGVSILISGLLLFFNRNLLEMISSFNAYVFGVILAALSAFSWVLFAMAQKVALKQFNSLQILFILNALGILFLMPFADFSAIFNLSTLQLCLLLYCGLNTVLGYGALAEAMRYWDVSKVSTIITLTPLFTLCFSELFATLWPNIFAHPNLNLLGYIGVFVVVFGAMFMVIGESMLKVLKRV